MPTSYQIFFSIKYSMLFWPLSSPTPLDTDLTSPASPSHPPLYPTPPSPSPPLRPPAYSPHPLRPAPTPTSSLTLYPPPASQPPLPPHYLPQPRPHSPSSFLISAVPFINYRLLSGDLICQPPNHSFFS